MDTAVLIEGKGGFPTLKIDNEYATALISVYGAQVLSFKPKLENSGSDNARDLLFLSDEAYYEQGKAIKGGIPICWPWFGNDPENSGRPAHGFARNTLWSLEKTASTGKGETQITLSLSDSEETQKLWPYAFKLTLLVYYRKNTALVPANQQYR